MRSTLKTIMTGVVAMAFFACGDNESSTAPENGNMPESNIVPESSAAQEVLSSSDAFHEESLQRWIKENYVTNMVTIDCPTTGPQEAHSCAEERLRIGANTLTHAWIGHSNYFACETDTSSLARYSVSVTSQTADVTDFSAKKILTTDNDQIIKTFKTDCEAEQGTYSVDSDGVSFCIVEVPPIDSTDLNNVHYTDPNWTKYSKAITSLCKDEPIEVHPIRHGLQGTRSPNPISP